MYDQWHAGYYDYDCRLAMAYCEYNYWYKWHYILLVVIYISLTEIVGDVCEAFEITNCKSDINLKDDPCNIINDVGIFGQVLLIIVVEYILAFKTYF